jgi:hypothetical protein
MFLFRKNNPAIVSGGTSVKPGQSPAQVMGFQTGLVEVFRHAPQGFLDLGSHSGVLSDQATECPLKLARRNKFTHGSLRFAQAGDETFSRLALEFAGAKGLNGALGCRRRFLAPCFHTTLAQQIFEHFLFIRRQRYGFSQNPI